MPARRPASLAPRPSSPCTTRAVTAGLQAYSVLARLQRLLLGYNTEAAARVVWCRQPALRDGVGCAPRHMRVCVLLISVGGPLTERSATQTRPRRCMCARAPWTSGARPWCCGRGTPARRRGTSSGPPRCTGRRRWCTPGRTTPSGLAMGSHVIRMPPLLPYVARRISEIDRAARRCSHLPRLLQVGKETVLCLGAQHDIVPSGEGGWLLNVVRSSERPRKSVGGCCRRDGCLLHASMCARSGQE